jgi:hypothetical protein
MINDTLNLLHIPVAYSGRALPLGWCCEQRGSGDKLIIVAPLATSTSVILASAPLSERWDLGFLPPLFSGCFNPLEET